MSAQAHAVLLIFIRAEPDQIGRALTTREASRRFLYEPDVDLRVGGRFALLKEGVAPPLMEPTP